MIHGVALEMVLEWFTGGVAEGPALGDQMTAFLSEYRSAGTEPSDQRIPVRRCLVHACDRLTLADEAFAILGEMMRLDVDLVAPYVDDRASDSPPSRRTILHDAVQYGTPDLVSWLLARGADPSATIERLGGAPVLGEGTSAFEQALLLELQLAYDGNLSHPSASRERRRANADLMRSWRAKELVTAALDASAPNFSGSPS